MQKAMEQMNIKLTNVLSDIVGKSGKAIISAILSGNHDPESLAQLADGRCKRSKADIAMSLEGASFVYATRCTLQRAHIIILIALILAKFMSFPKCSLNIENKSLLL